jgi:transcriptional regulatory protein RtcR
MSKPEQNVVFGFLGLDHDMRINSVTQRQRSVSLFEHPEFPVQVFHVIYSSVSPETEGSDLVDAVLSDIARISPSTILESHIIDFMNPWDFREVYRKLFQFCENFKFNPGKENYFFHITIGTYVQQICAYLLTESHRFPGKFLQTYDLSPHRKNIKPGYVILDPHDLPISIKEYTKQDVSNNSVILKSGFTSVNKEYNSMIDDLLQAAENSREPILLLGETGTGKSMVARRIHEVKNSIFHLRGHFVEINCATISRDLAIATLFGYRKGDYSGAFHDQAGVLRQADGGMLFLDEIGELSLEVQAMLLKAVETKRFKVFGIHEEIETDFQLVCGTNRNLEREARLGCFREDLLARINFWAFTLPPLRRRLDDIPNLVNFFIDEWSRENNNIIITFEQKARKTWLDFAAAPNAPWKRNLRELNHSVKKMCYYSRVSGDIITGAIVQKAIRELQRSWHTWPVGKTNKLIPPELLLYLHKADMLALEKAMRVCGSGGSLRDVGHALFYVPSDMKGKNYSDLARKFLDRCTAKLPGAHFVLEHGKGLVLQQTIKPSRAIDTD